MQKERRTDLVEEIKLLSSSQFINLNLLVMVEHNYKLIKQLKDKLLKQLELLQELMVMLFM